MKRRNSYRVVCVKIDPITSRIKKTEVYRETFTDAASAKTMAMHAGWQAAIFPPKVEPEARDAR